MFSLAALSVSLRAFLLHRCIVSTCGLIGHPRIGSLKPNAVMHSLSHVNGSARMWNSGTLREGISALSGI